MPRVTNQRCGRCAALNCSPPSGSSGPDWRGLFLPGQARKRRLDRSDCAGAKMQTQLTSAAERIRLAMAPDPADWFFTGEVVDHGEYGSAACTCGHPVRYQFFIARACDGNGSRSGSYCIRESVPFLDRRRRGRARTRNRAGGPPGRARPERGPQGRRRAAGVAPASTRLQAAQGVVLGLAGANGSGATDRTTGCRLFCTGRRSCPTRQTRTRPPRRFGAATASSLARGRRVRARREIRAPTAAAEPQVVCTAREARPGGTRGSIVATGRRRPVG